MECEGRSWSLFLGRFCRDRMHLFFIMKIAVPLADDGSFSLHYGGASKVALFEVDQPGRRILHVAEVQPPEPEPCGWAGWLAHEQVNVILAGGMGRGAQMRMAELGILVQAGMPAAEPRALVQAWLNGAAAAGDNLCEGGHHGRDHEGHHGSHGCSCSH